MVFRVSCSVLHNGCNAPYQASTQRAPHYTQHVTPAAMSRIDFGPISDCGHALSPARTGLPVRGELGIIDDVTALLDVHDQPRLVPQLFQVVVSTKLRVKDVDHNSAIVQQNPA